METFGTLLVTINLAAIIPFLFIFAVLVLTFVIMVATAVLDRAPRKAPYLYKRDYLGASGV